MAPPGPPSSLWQPKWQQWSPDVDRKLCWPSNTRATSGSYHSWTRSSRASHSHQCFQSTCSLSSREPGALGGSEPCNLFSHHLPLVATPSSKKSAISHWTPLHVHYIPLDENYFPFHPKWQQTTSEMYLGDRDSNLSVMYLCSCQPPWTSGSSFVRWHTYITWSLCALPMQNSV